MGILKRISITLFSLLAAFGCFGQNIENDWTKDQLIGKVKSYAEVAYKVEDRSGKIEKIEKLKSHYSYFDSQKKYDEKGNLIELNAFNTDGSLDVKETYTYDDKGKLVEFNSYPSDSSLLYKNMYSYDDMGNMIAFNCCHSNKSMDYTFSFKYDEKGNHVESNKFNSDGKLEEKATYTYDGKGNKIEASYYLDSSLYFRETYAYDNKGNIIELNSYYSDSSLEFRETYTYDDKGNKIELNKYNSNNSLESRETYKYDEKGNLTEKYMFRLKTTFNTGENDADSKEKKNENQYNGINDDGNLEMAFTYKYDYDEKGNWIKKTYFKNQIPIHMYEREYEYY